MSVLRLARAELGRLLRRRAALFVFLVPALVAALRVAMPVALGAGLSAARAENGFGPLADGLRIGGAALTFVLLLGGSLSVVRERESGHLGLSLLAASRGALFLAKTLVQLSVLAGAAALLLCAAVGSAATCHDLGPLVEDGFEMATTSELWSNVWHCLGAALPAWFAAAVFALTVSTLSSTTGAAVFAALLPVTLFGLASGLGGDAWTRVFLAHVPFVGDDSALSRLPDLSRGFSDVYFEPGELAAACSVSLWQALALMALGWLVMRVRPAV